nr:hypothetical protein [Tanacetum cinerariifolium]
MIWVTSSKTLLITFAILVVLASLKRLFVIPRLPYEPTSSLEELLEVSNLMAYSSSSLSKVEHSSSLDSFLAFKARDLLSHLALTILKSFLMIISWTLRLPMNSSRDSDVKSFDSLIVMTFALHLGCRALKNFLT